MGASARSRPILSLTRYSPLGRIFLGLRAPRAIFRVDKDTCAQLPGTPACVQNNRTAKRPAHWNSVRRTWPDVLRRALKESNLILEIRGSRLEGPRPPWTDKPSCLRNMSWQLASMRSVRNRWSQIDV